MENTIPKESLLFIVVVLSGYGVKVIDTNIVNGIIALVVAAGLLILRAYLKKQGWEISGKR